MVPSRVLCGICENIWLPQWLVFDAQELWDATANFLETKVVLPPQDFRMSSQLKLQIQNLGNLADPKTKHHLMYKYKIFGDSGFNIHWMLKYSEHIGTLQAVAIINFQHDLCSDCQRVSQRVLPCLIPLKSWESGSIAWHGRLCKCPVWNGKNACSNASYVSPLAVCWSSMLRSARSWLVFHLLVGGIP